MKLKLTLENGMTFEAKSFGHEVTTPLLGEIVFNTSMTGYQEILSDPSYCDQMVVMTYPLIGNYGVNKDDFESMIPSLKALIVSEACESPSNWRNEYSIASLLKEFKIPGIQGIDSRKLTKIVRKYGTMKAIISPVETNDGDIQQLLKKDLPTDQIKRVSSSHSIHFPGDGKRVVIIDYGYKKNILRSLSKRGLDIVVVPFDSSLDQIEKFKPSGVVLSNGPGDPKSIPEALPVIRSLQEKYPMMCICMGHQLFALANGADTEKLSFGHRGANHPVKDLETGKVFITSQNHSYAVRDKSIEQTSLIKTQVNINDNTVEGLAHKNFPAFSVQYHPEAYPGPDDTQFLFDTFLESLR